MSETMLSKKALAEMFGVSEITIDRWRKRKENPLPKPALGNSCTLRWEAKDIRTWLERNKEVANA